MYTKQNNTPRIVKLKSRYLHNMCTQTHTHYKDTHTHTHTRTALSSSTQHRHTQSTLAVCCHNIAAVHVYIRHLIRYEHNVNVQIKQIQCSPHVRMSYVQFAHSVRVYTCHVSDCVHIQHTQLEHSVCVYTCDIYNTDLFNM